MSASRWWPVPCTCCVKAPVVGGTIPRAHRLLSMTRRFYAWELGIVLALSLGRAAVYAVLRLAEITTAGPIGSHTATVQRSRSQEEFFDATYQILDALFALAPVALVIYLVFLQGRNPFRAWGLDFRRPVHDGLFGVGLFMLIGIGTLGVYGLGRAAGVTAQIVPADVGEYWWTGPVLLLSALRHSLLEEVVMIAYLFDRCRRIWPQASIWMIIIGSAILRGTYHLYQGIGPGIGNLLMGIIFGWAYHRWGRVMPLVVAHFLLDAVAFFAFPLIIRAVGLDVL